MTRYARARGSKASNEKLPSDATPWHVMKQQLEENLTKHKDPLEKTKSAKELLAATQNITHPENIQNSWAEFENNSKQKCDKKNQKLQINSDDKNQNKPIDKDEWNIKSKRKLSAKRNINEVDTFVPNVTNKKLTKYEHQSDKSKSKEDLRNTTTNKTETDSDKINEERRQTEKDISEAKRGQNSASNNMHGVQIEKKPLSKRQKRNMKKKMRTEDFSNSYKKDVSNGSIHNCANSGENKNNEATEKVNKNFATKSYGFKNIPRRFGTKKFDTQKGRKPPKIRDDKEHKRRKADLGPSKMMINGVEVEIVKFDGFPVKKEDAGRLKDLRQKMVMRGIPKKEIDAAMKLERRKAEKALARIRKCVCFHCRKAGHNLSDCPELGTQEAVTGICFKCGSTEHTHFQCKVAKPTEYRFATCFICREQGHIAKQCPDNPKGIYPQGGCCKICGDVTHLKKDCPDLIKEKEESTVRADVIVNDNLESLGEYENNAPDNANKNSKKIVTF